MSFLGKALSSPIDPITSKVFDKLPDPLKKISDPLNLKRRAESPEGRSLLDPLNVEKREGGSLLK